ncbi:MAG: hypothetical protein ABIP96_03320 [Patescibacteria group bacterium]
MSMMIGVLVDPKTHAKAKKYARAEYRSMSAFARKALDEYLEKLDRGDSSTSAGTTRREDKEGVASGHEGAGQPPHSARKK